MVENWNPMESAPKDGTRILVADADGLVTSAFWTAGYLRADHWRISVPGAYAEEDDFDDPVAWMPCPQYKNG